jgi:hypothetical protein
MSPHVASLLPPEGAPRQRPGKAGSVASCLMGACDLVTANTLANGDEYGDLS